VSEATGLPEIVFLKTTDYKEWSDGDVIKKARVDETRYGRSSTSVDQLRQFLKAKTKLPLTLPGCLPKFDVFADRFLEASGDLGRQKAIAARTEEATETCCTKSPSKRKRAERYLKLMQGKCDCCLSHSFSWTISLNLWPKNLVVKLLGLFSRCSGSQRSTKIF